MFSGIGGFENGIERATKGKWDCIGFSEIDKYAIQIYERHFKHKNYGDATKINAKELPDFDMLCGGFPCQSFSVAGKRKGFQDTRGTLFYEIYRIVEAKRPRLLLLENVKGLLSADDGRCFATIISSLDELGYNVEWCVLNSKNFGVPQNRERVFIIGHLRGESRGQVFPIGKSSKKTIRTVFPNIPEIGEEFRIYKDKGIAPTVKGNIRVSIKDKFQKTVYDPKGISPTVREGHGDVIRILQINKPKHSFNRYYDTKGISPAMRSSSGNKVPKIEIKPNVMALDLYNKKVHLDRTPALTEPHHNSLRMMVDNKIRKLTPVECERLQGFPDGWTEKGINEKGEEVIISNTQRYKTLGNAVSCPVIEAIIKNI